MHDKTTHGRDDGEGEPVPALLSSCTPSRSRCVPPQQQRLGRRRCEGEGMGMPMAANRPPHCFGIRSGVPRPDLFIPPDSPPREQS